MINSIWQQGKAFLLTYLGFFLVGIGLLFTLNLGDLVLYFNFHQNNFSNVFFTLITLAAEWKILLLVFAGVLWYSYRSAVFILISWLSSGVIAQILKKLVFRFDRPAQYFKDDVVLHFLDNAKIHFHNSFPSGHTTVAFAVFFALSLSVKNKYYQIMFALIAISVALSRVYLLLHFLRDVLAGSVLGVLITAVIFVIMNTYPKFGLSQLEGKSLSKYVKKQQ